MVSEANLIRPLPTQQRSKETRQSIMDAAERLWRTHEFDSVSVGDVCNEAGVAKGTFYLYFPRKEHLLVMLVFARISLRPSERDRMCKTNMTTFEVLQESAMLIARRSKLLPKHLLRRGVEASFQYFEEIRQLPDSQPSLRFTLLPILERGLARGEIEDWNLDLLSMTIGWSLLQGVLHWSTGRITERMFFSQMRERVEFFCIAAKCPRAKSDPPAAVDAAASE